MVLRFPVCRQLNIQLHQKLARHLMETVTSLHMHRIYVTAFDLSFGILV